MCRGLFDTEKGESRKASLRLNHEATMLRQMLAYEVFIISSFYSETNRHLWSAEKWGGKFG